MVDPLTRRLEGGQEYDLHFLADFVLEPAGLARH